MKTNMRLIWKPEVEKSLHRAVLMAINGKFIKLLQLPEQKRKQVSRKMSYGWEEVRQILAEEHPDFKPTRQQVADKWRKSRSAAPVSSDGQQSHEEDPHFNIDLLGESEDFNYVCPHEIAKKEGREESAVRTEWCSKAEASLHRAVQVALDGKFIELLELPDYEKKGRRQELTNGWEEVKQIMAEEHPEFEPTRAQIGDKWRKSHLRTAMRKTGAKKTSKSKIKDDKDEIDSSLHEQLLLSSSILDLVKTEIEWTDDEADQYDDGQYNDDDDDFDGANSKSNLWSESSKKIKTEEDSIAQKQLDFIDDQKSSILKLEERKRQMMEAEHEKRLEVMMEESDLRKALMKEEFNSKLLILEQHYKMNREFSL